MEVNILLLIKNEKGSRTQTIMYLNQEVVIFFQSLNSCPFSGISMFEKPAFSSSAL